MTRVRVKQLNQHVNLFLAEFNLRSNDNSILPNACTLNVLRFAHVHTLEDGEKKDGSAEVKLCLMAHTLGARTERAVRDVRANTKIGKEQHPALGFL